MARTHRDLFKSKIATCLKSRCTTPACWQLLNIVQRHGHSPNKHSTNLRPNRPKSKERCLTSHTRTEGQINGWVRERITVIDMISNVSKSVVLGKSHQPPKVDRWTSLSPLGDHRTIKSHTGDQPSGGETTWTNTGGTRYGRGKHKTG